MNNHVCSFCGNTGSHGAMWILSFGNERYRVHKPCGAKLAAHAPDGTSPKLEPSPELRREWKAARKAATQQRAVKAFWAEKFKAAQAARTKAA